MAHDHDHVHGPDCDHGHDHAHGETHTHAPSGEYYIEQLLTLFVCGAFGLVGILMTRARMLDIILAPEFHNWVMAGGIVLLLFTAVRGIVIWRTVGQPIDCGHDHAPGEDHTHGNIFWRVVVLSFPLLLFLLGLPNKGFSQEWIERRLGTNVAVDAKEVAEKGGETSLLDFAELNSMAYDEGKRKEFEGRTVRVKGQLNKINDRVYTLFKLKMNCCAADIIPLKAQVQTSFVPTFKSGDWVWAEGVLQFVEDPAKKLYIPVIRVKEAKGLTKAPAE